MFCLGKIYKLIPQKGCCDKDGTIPLFILSMTYNICHPPTQSADSVKNQLLILNNGSHFFAVVVQTKYPGWVPCGFLWFAEHNEHK